MGAGPRPRKGRFTAGDAVVDVGALLLFVDSFLHWERTCISILRSAPICVDYWTAWSGRGTFAGVVMAVLAAGVLVWHGLLLVSDRLGDRWGPASALRALDDRQRAAISTGLAAGTVAFGVQKLVFVVADHSTYGSYVAAVLLVIIGGGALLKLGETRQ